MAEAVRLWLSRNGRELSPIYLAGESYGGFRVAELSKRLLDMGLGLQGTVMISPALEFSVLRGDDYAILPPSFALPSLAAAAIELRDGPGAPLDPVREAEDYARTAYLVHLASGIKQDDSVVAALARSLPASMPAPSPSITAASPPSYSCANSYAGQTGF